MDKRTIRQMMKAKRLQHMKTFSAYSSLICQSVLSHPQISKSTLIACYVSLTDEVDTHELINELLKTHQVCVPKVHGNTMDFYEIRSFNDLTEGCFHVLVPTTDLLI
ncbi:MAG: 5-formyltetrahydrofolate cyclo-ligase, partial [Erysipelotrichaceae bacterium]|nr:5-formyltetrahydrofolate cyclo-ligase [Erysipelotrichaceae bacterium]